MVSNAGEAAFLTTTRALVDPFGPAEPISSSRLGVVSATPYRLSASPGCGCPCGHRSRRARAGPAASVARRSKVAMAQEWSPPTTTGRSPRRNSAAIAARFRQRSRRCSRSSRTAPIPDGGRPTRPPRPSRERAGQIHGARAVGPEPAALARPRSPKPPGNPASLAGPGAARWAGGGGPSGPV